MYRGSTVNVSTVNVERVNSQCREGQQSMYRGSTVNVQRVNGQCTEGQQSMYRGSTVKVIASIDPGVGGSMINAERTNSQLSLSHGKAIGSVDPGGVDQ